MACYGLEGTYLDMCNLITQKYVGQYTQLKSGREPDKGDAVWLVDRGIRTEDGLKQFLGISTPLLPTEPPILPPMPPIERPIPLIEGKIDPKIIIIAVIAFILLLRR